MNAAIIQTITNSSTDPPAKTECKTKGMGISVKEIATTKDAAAPAQEREIQIEEPEERREAPASLTG
jgi:hypothetical protein